jgi:tRNA modification GTPase
MSDSPLFDFGEQSPPRVALLTATGGALSIVGVAGLAAGRLMEPFVGIVSTRPERLKVGEARVWSWRHQTLAVVEPVMLVRVATDCWEIHAHGGKMVSDSIVRDLCEAGAVECSGGEWRGAPVESGESSIRRRLAEAGGWRAAQILSRQLAGYFDTEVGSIEQFVIESSFGTTAGLFEAEHNLLRLERAARVGLRLPIPWRVVLRGVVNAGKSSLVNALAGYARSLVSPMAGTTRDLIETRLVLDGWEIDLIDTAGEIESKEVLPTGVELAGIKRGRAAAGAADLVLELTPASDLLNSAVRGGEDTAQRLIVATKADLLQPGEIARITAGGHIIATSALTGAGIDSLAEAIIRRLVPEEAEGDLDQGVPVTSGQLQRIQQLQQRLRQLCADGRDRITPGLTDPESGA